MSKPNPVPSEQPSAVIQERSAELPRSVSRPSVKRKQGIRRSTRLGYLFFLQNSGRLSPGQHRFLLKEQSLVRLNELERAVDLFGKLVASPRSVARVSSEIEDTLKRCPSLTSESVPREQRRIGVGYRDKGSLRPFHKRRQVASRCWWSEDIAPALSHVPEEPRWISADEVFGLKGSNILQELALSQLILNSSLPYLSEESKDSPES